MQTKLRILFNEAKHQLNTYKHPDVSEFKKEIAKVLDAAELGNLDGEYIEYLSEYGDKVEVNTTWSSRGCIDSNCYSFPSQIIDSDDPIRDATLFGLSRRMKDAKEKQQRHQSIVDYYNTQVNEIQLELNEVRELIANGHVFTET